jgi:hypothetical protein
MLLSGTNAVKVFRTGIMSPAAFYRAVQQDVTNGFQITAFSPATGLPGTEVLIEGSFSVPPGDTDKLVRFGGALAEPVSASDYQWRVVVPAGAESGPLRLLTATTNTESRAAFTVLGLAPATVVPPAGMAATEFTLVNTFGGTVTNQGTNSFRVRNDLFTLNMARDAQTNVVLYAISLSSGQPVTLSVESTACALVFLSPVFATMDPLMASHTLDLIQRDTNVLALAALLAPLYRQPGDPYTNSAVLAKYTEAVRSVAGSPVLGSLTAAARKAKQPASLAATVAVGDYSLDLEFTFVATHKKKVPYGPYVRKVESNWGPRFPYLNPVDWLVLVQEIDAANAFPQGRIDLENLLRDKRRLEQFPFKTLRLTNEVEAELVTEKFNPVKFGLSELMDTIQDVFLPKEETIHFPERDGVYLVRAIGPGINDGAEADFVARYYPEERYQIVAGNLLAATMDTVGLLIDLETFDLKGKQELAAKMAVEANKYAHQLSEPADFGKLALELAKFMLTEVIDKLKDEGLKAANDCAGRLLKTLGKLGSPLSFFDKIGGAGQVFQREYGLLTTTPMESTVIVFGDPFKISTVIITPPQAAAGDEIQINFQGAGISRLYDPAQSRDTVDFNGTDIFYGEVLQISGTPGNQTLRVRIPTNLTVSADGKYTVSVNVQGRRGEAAFTLATEPKILQVTPAIGFAAVTNFMGTNFPGSLLRVKGLLFTPTDRFFFGWGSGQEVQTKSGSTGDVQVRIPIGARTSVLRVVHTNNAGLPVEAYYDPMVGVWAPPVIDSVMPASAPVGLPVALRVRYAGTESSLVLVQFSGMDPQGVSLYGDGTLRTTVPAGATTGPLTVITPAGSNSIPFTVSPGVYAPTNVGSGITVGGASVVGFERAVAFAQGTGYPADDATDPPYDEGDFVTKVVVSNLPAAFILGPVARNAISISGTYGGDFTLTTPETYTGGTLTGAITVTGDTLMFNTVTFLGPVVVSGRSNTFYNCVFSNTVTVTGSGNSIGKTILGQLIIEGDNNNTQNTSLFRYTPSHALIIRGNHNFIDSGNFYGNAGDAVRVEGGQFNTIKVNYSQTNAGNGITLTGGAAYNNVGFNSGLRTGALTTLGNWGHGIALLDDAHDNSFYSIGNGASGNALDGAFLSGSNVVRNQFGGNGISFTANCNGRNGITMTNGVAYNVVGYVADTTYGTVTINSNAANGLMLSGAKFTTAAVWTRSNMLNGVLVSDVQDPPSGTRLVVLSGSSSAPGNGRTGLRLENNVTGVYATSPYDLTKNQVGVEFDGTNVQGNYFEGYVSASQGDGVILRGARRNELNLTVQNCSGSGVVLYGAEKNLVRISDAKNNLGDGIDCVGGSENQFTTGSASLFRRSLSRNRNGIVLEQGAHDNVVSLLRFTENRQCGILVDGSNTIKNSFFSTDLLNCGQEGMRVQNGASGITFGKTEDNPAYPVRSCWFQDNTNAAVRITGPGTRDLTFAGCYVSKLWGGQPAGIIVENNAADVFITHSTFSQNTNGVIVKDGARAVTLQESIVESNVENGIWVANGAEVQIGVSDATLANECYSNGVAIRLTGSAATRCWIQNNNLHHNARGILLEAQAHQNMVGPANTLDHNGIGLTVDYASTNTIGNNAINASAAEGIQFRNGASDNWVFGNTITRNNVGVSVAGAYTQRNAILNNSITANGGNGIRLLQGGNNGIAAPVFQLTAGESIRGTARAPDGSRVQIFKDPGLEGEALLATAQIVNGQFCAPVTFEPWKVGILFNLSATVTDPYGNTSEFQAKFPSLGAAQRMVFTSTRTGNAEIFMLNPPLETPVNLTLTNASSHSPALAAGFSNANEVLFVSDRTGNQEIFSMPAVAGAQALQLTTHTAADYDPAWLQPCAKVVFVSERDGNPEIFSMNADGSLPTRLTFDANNDRHPSPSPDGSKILFQSDRSGRMQLWIMNADVSDQHPLLTSSAADTQPVMSPDGAYIAFVSDRDGNPEIYCVQADGSGLQRVTWNALPDRDPTWTSDGASIVYASQRTGGAELFLIPRGGGLPQPVTLSSGDNTQPAFARR